MILNIVKSKDFILSTLDCLLQLILISIAFFIVGIYNVRADVYFGYNSSNYNVKVPYNNSVVVSGNRTIYFDFNDGNLYSDSDNTPIYFKHTFCVDTTISSWDTQGNPTWFKQLGIYKTDIKCYYPGSSYGGGRLLYIYGMSNVSAICNSSLQNCRNGGRGYFYLDNNSSWTLLQESYSKEYIEIDFGQNQGNNYSSETSNNTYNTANNTNNINSSINDDSIDTNNTSSSASSWSNMNASDNTITNLLTLPIQLLQAYTNGMSGTCSSFDLGSLFGTNITLPCINIGNLIGSGLWTTIDVLFSGFMIFAIAKKLIKIFNDFTNLRSNQVDELYGGGA